MLSKNLNSKRLAGSRESKEPRLVGKILSDRFENGSDNFAAAWRQHTASATGTRKEVIAL